MWEKLVKKNITLRINFIINKVNKGGYSRVGASYNNNMCCSYSLTKKKSPVTCHMWHVTCHMSHVTCHMSHVTCYMLHVTCHMSHGIWHMSHVPRHMSHVTCHMSHVTCHQRQQPHPKNLHLLIPPLRTVAWFTKTEPLPKKHSYKNKECLNTFFFKKKKSFYEFCNFSYMIFDQMSPTLLVLVTDG